MSEPRLSLLSGASLNPHYGKKFFPSLRALGLHRTESCSKRQAGEFGERSELSAVWMRMQDTPLLDALDPRFRGAHERQHLQPKPNRPRPNRLDTSGFFANAVLMLSTIADDTNAHRQNADG